MPPGSIKRVPLRSGWSVTGQYINLHKKEHLTLCSSTFQIENYLKTSWYKRWQLFFSV
jgi:hypothetical protein